MATHYTTVDSREWGIEVSHVDDGFYRTHICGVTEISDNGGQSQSAVSLQPVCGPIDDWTGRRQDRQHRIRPSVSAKKALCALHSFQRGALDADKEYGPRVS